MELYFHLCVCTKSTPGAFSMHTLTHCTWDFPWVSQSLQKAFKSLQLKSLQFRKKKRKKKLHGLKRWWRLVISCLKTCFAKVCGESSCISSQLYLERWRQEYRWARTASGVEKGREKRKKNAWLSSQPLEFHKDTLDISQQRKKKNSLTSVSNNWSNWGLLLAERKRGGQLFSFFFFFLSRVYSWFAHYDSFSKANAHYIIISIHKHKWTRVFGY